MELLAAADAYGWMKWLHVVGVFVYAGGFLTLTRLIGRAVRYESALSRGDALATLKRMHKFVDWGGAGLALIGGLYLLLRTPSIYLKQPYFHVKLTFIVVLAVCDVLVTRKLFAADPENPPGAGFFRIMHGVVGLAILGVFFAIFIVR